MAASPACASVKLIILTVAWCICWVEQNTPSTFVTVHRSLGYDIPWVFPRLCVLLKRRFLMDFHCLPLLSLYSLFPSSYPFAEEQWEGDLTALLPFLGTHPSTLFPQTFALLTALQKLHWFVISPVASPCTFINLRHIHFTPIASNKSLIFGKYTGDVYRFRKVTLFFSFIMEAFPPHISIFLYMKKTWKVIFEKSLSLFEQWA